MSVNLTSLNSGKFRATIIVVSNDMSSIGEYCIEQQKYISKAASVDLTRSCGLGGVQGIAKKSREIKEEEDKQVMDDDLNNTNSHNNTKSHLNNVKMTSETILNNSGILEHIVGFIGKTVGFNHNIMIMLHLLIQQLIIISSSDCKSMVHLSLTCKQLSSDVNTIAGRILNSAERFARHESEVLLCLKN